MPIQVERLPSDTLDGDARTFKAKQQAHQHQQQQLAHREALRLALGSILTPKRPHSASANPSRSSSGTASPAYFSSALSGASGTHTPVGTPPVGYGYYPLAHGPNSSENTHLHPHYGHNYHAPPSRLGPSRSVSSTAPSPSNSAQASAHPSPRPGTVSTPNSQASAPPIPPDLEPLPPAVIDTPGAAQDSLPKPVRPPITPLHASKDGSFGTSDYTDEHRHEDASGTTSSGRSTPRSKFLQTLQSKSAWDALIHGSFS